MNIVRCSICFVFSIPPFLKLNLSWAFISYLYKLQILYCRLTCTCMHHFQCLVDCVVVVWRGTEAHTTESARRDKRPSSVYCVAVGHMFLLCGAEPYVPYVFVNICYESYHLLQKHMSKSHTLQNHMAQNHMAQIQVLKRQLVFLTIEPSAGHVIKYYKDCDSEHHYNYVLL